MNVSFFKNIKDKEPITSFSLVALLSNDGYKGKVLELRQAQGADRRKIKESLPAFTPSGVFENRKDESLVEHNGVICIDIDGADNPMYTDWEDVKKQLKGKPSLLAASLSCGGNGLALFFLTECKNAEQHPAYYEYVEKYVRSIGLIPDEKCKNVGRLRFISYDENPYICEDAKPISLKDITPKTAKTAPPVAYNYNNDNTIKVEEIIQELEENSIDITDDYAEWVRVGMALSSLGEDGRGYFHRVSALSPKYNTTEVDKKYSDCLNNTEKIELGTFFYIASRTRTRTEKINTFPISIFPEVIQEIISECERCLGFNSEYFAGSLLYAASVAMGNSLQIKFKNEFTQKGNIFMAIVGGRGTNKSAPLSWAIKPLSDDDYENYIEWKRVVKTLDKTTEKPPLKQCLCCDFTPEVLTKILGDNPRGLGVYNDELLSFVNGFNRYKSGKSNDQQTWLQIWSGVVARKDRISSDNEFTKNPFVSVTGTIQPEVLNELTANRINDGFLDRFLFVYPEKVLCQCWNENQISSGISANWRTIIKNLSSLPYEESPRIIPLSHDAFMAMLKWQQGVTYKCNNGASELYKGIATKAQLYALRFALILQAMKYATEPEEWNLEEINVEIIHDAISLATYFINTALKVHSVTAANKTKTKYSDFLEALPKMVQTAEAEKIGESMGISRATIHRLFQKKELFEKIKQGTYKKL